MAEEGREWRDPTTSKEDIVLTGNLIQIIYVSIMGTAMLMAFLEWFLWLAAFLYCLIKVYQKAEHWSIRMLAAIMMMLFTALRSAGCANTYPPRTDSIQQSHLPPRYDRYAPFAGPNYAVLPSSHGVLSSMVRILDVRRSTDNPMAVLRLSTRYQQPRSYKAYQTRSGRRLGSKDRHSDAGLQGRAGGIGHSD